MAYVVASDRTGGAPQCLDTTCAKLEEKGNSVKKLNVDPNSEGTVVQNCTPEDIVVFIVNGVCLGTIDSFYTAFIEKKKAQHVFFCFPKPLMQGSHFNKKELFSTKKLVITEDGDNWSQRAREMSGKYTPVEVFEKYNGVDGIWAEDCEELAQLIIDGGGLQGGGSGTTESSSGGGVAIKDKTFEDCIRRICAATDSVFLVENNAAIMFPYTDWMAFTLRQKVKKIKANMIDSDLFEMEYNTDGYYNKVTTVYGAEEDTTTDKSKKTQNDQNNNNNTETNKNGNVTQERKSMPTGGTQLSQQYDPLVKKYGVLEKKVTTNFPNEETAQYVSNALLIQYVREFNNSCRFRMLNNQKLIGGTFYDIQNPFDKKTQLFYLNSYTIAQRKKEPITSDVDFKYGPEGVENIMDYQRYSGTGGGSASTGGTASSSEEAIWQDAAKVHYLRRDSRTCSNQDPKGAYDTIHPKLGQDDCFADCYGMSAYLYYRFNNEANIPCRVVGNSTHHVVMLFKNNAWYEPRSEYKQLEGNFAWKTNQCTDVLLAEPSNPNSSASGNTGSNAGSNNNGGNNSGGSGGGGGAL